MADLERRLSEEEQDIERGALTDWEVQYARAKLDLKEKHYKVRTRLQIKEGGTIYERGSGLTVAANISQLRSQLTGKSVKKENWLNKINLG